MKPSRIFSAARLSLPLATALVALFNLTAQRASAVDLYWDQNSTTAGFGTAGGTWDASGSSTWGDSIGTAAIVNTNTLNTDATTDALNFGTAADGLGAGTIAAVGTVSAGDITFGSASGAIVLSGGTISLTAASTITVNNASDTISSVLSGAGTSLTKAGTGTLILSGSNTYLGATNINGGTLSVATDLVANGSNSALGAGTALTFDNNGIFRYTGADAPAFNRIITLNSGGGTVDQSNGGFMFWAGTVSGSGSLTKIGAGQLIISGNNTYSGITNINVGQIQLRNSNALGTTAGKTIVANGAILTAGGGGTMTIPENIDLNGTGGGSGALQSNDGGTNATFSGTIALVTTSGVGGATNFTISGPVTGAAGADLTKLSANTVTLSGNNTFAGNVTINNGTLNATTSRVGSNPTVSSLGNPQAAGRTVTIASGGTLNFGASDVMGDGGSNTIALTLIANGGTIRNTSSQFNSLGPVQLNGGTLASFGGKASTFPSFCLFGTITVGGSAVSTISTTGTNSQMALSNAGTTFDVADAVSGSGSDLNVTGVLANFNNTSSGLIKTGAGTMTLGGANTYTGATNVSGGTLQVTGKLGNTSNVYAGALAIASGATFQYGGSVGQTLSGVVGAGGGILSKAGGGDLILTNGANAYDELMISAGRVFINNNAGALTTAAAVALTGGSLVFGTTGTYNNAITVSSGANISARAARSLSNVTLPGSGSVIFNNDDSVTVGLTITNDQTLSGNLSIQLGGTNLTVGTATLSGIISGASGAITKTSTGTLSLTGANTYTGATTVTTGTLSLGNGTANTTLADTAGVVIGTDASAVLNLNYSGTDTVATLSIDGAAKAAGIWGSSTSGAPNTDPKLTGTGTLTVSPAPVGGYSSWITGFGLAPADQDPTDDPENDGMNNLIEFVLNGNPSLSDTSILPTLVVTATDFEFTYQRRDDSVSPETTQTFQWGTTLATWPGSAVIPATSGTVVPATVTVSPGIPDDAVTDTVKISIPKTEADASGKLFGRLQAVK